jgi:hypothetical protein
MRKAPIQEKLLGRLGRFPQQHLYGAWISAVVMIFDKGRRPTGKEWGFFIDGSREYGQEEFTREATIRKFRTVHTAGEPSRHDGGRQ